MHYNTSFKTNIFLIQFLYLIFALSLSWDVIQILFFRDLGFTFFEIGILLLVASLVTIIFEVPSGNFTDIYGRKFSLLIVFILLLLSSILLIIFSNYLMIMIAFILLAISRSFWSGTTDSLLFESLKKINRKTIYQKIMSRNHFFLISVGVLTNFMVPVIFGYNTKYPFIFASIFAIIGLVSCLLLKESKIKDTANRQSFYDKYYLTLKDSIKQISGSNNLIYLIVFSAILGSSLVLFADIINQPFIQDEWSLTYYGMIFSLATILQSLLVLKVNSIIKLFKKFNIYLVLSLIVPINLILMLYFVDLLYVLIPLMAVFWFFGSLRYIFISNEINNKINDDKSRASVHSINNMFMSLLTIVLAPIFGLVIDSLGINYSIQILAIYILVSCLIITKLKFLNKLKN